MIKLLLPAVIPSWRFFDTIASSPRIEYRLLATAQDAEGNWQEFRPRPERLRLSDMLKRMFWNPRWNESLFLVSCAERLMAGRTQENAEEIAARIKAGLGHDCAEPCLQFRLAFLSRVGTQLHKDITYISPIYLRAHS